MAISSQRITSNTSYYMIALTTQKILAFIYFILIARFLGAEDIGKYALAVSFIQILAIFMDIGLSPSITRESSRDPDVIKRYFSNILGFKLIMSVIAVAILVVLAHLFGYSQLVKELLYLASIVMILDSLTLTFYAMLRGLHVLHNESAGVIIYQVLVISLSLFGLYSGADVRILIIALIAGSIFNFGWSLTALKKYSHIRFSIAFDWQTLKPLFLIALPFGITAIFIKLYQLGDTVLLSILSNEKELGWYSVSHKLVFALEFIPLAIIASIFPAMSSYFTTDKEKMYRTFESSSYYLMIIALPILMGGFVLAEPMVVALYGTDFIPSAESLKILLLSLLFLFLNYPLSSLLGAINKQKINMYFMGIAAFMSIMLNLFLIPRFGGLGAAWALLISLTFLFAVYIGYIRRVVGISLKKYFTSLLSILLVSLVMAFVVMQGELITTWWISMILGFIVYVFLLFMFKHITRKDIERLYNGMKGRQS
jgi:O-antigen/teichoic acid export membrane protein